jgi:MFS family permease
MPWKNPIQQDTRNKGQSGLASTRTDAGRRPSPASADRILWLCFFASGMTGLVYEVLWTRIITNVIGGAPFAVAIVLTIFMGGIGAGSHLAGRIVDRQERASALVRLYGRLELVIAGCALLVPLAVIALKPAYGWIYQKLYDHFLLYNLLVFAACCVTLAIPSLCMGATLPVLCRYQIREWREAGRGAGLLYALNTAGAALGALLGGLWLVPRLGVWGTLAVVAAVNAGIGCVALVLARHIEASQVPATHRATGARPAAAAGRVKRIVLGGVLLLFGVSGFCSMSYEVIWTKLLALIVGPTNYSFTVILVAFILGLAGGQLSLREAGRPLGTTGEIAGRDSTWRSTACVGSQPAARREPIILCQADGTLWRAVCAPTVPEGSGAIHPSQLADGLPGSGVPARGKNLFAPA